MKQEESLRSSARQAPMEPGDGLRSQAGAFLFGLLFLVGVVQARAEIRFGVCWYSEARDQTVIEEAAQRLSLAVSGKNTRSDADRPVVKKLNPGFLWFAYNSVTDNYVPPHDGDVSEHELLLSLARAGGLEEDGGYLHYYDDTRVVLQGDTILIRGWGGGTAAKPEEARIPVYDKRIVRMVVNLSTARARRIERRLMVSRALDTPYQGSDLYPDGIFLDNAAPRLFNRGSLISGGAVREAAGRAVIGTPEFTAWYWSDNLAPFLAEFKDTLETSAAWSRDRRRKFLMINVANVWDDTYVSRDVADYLFLESLYDPVRNVGPGALDEAYRRDALAAAAGIVTCYAPGITRSAPDVKSDAAFSFGEALLGNLASFLVTRTTDSVLMQMGSRTPVAAGWDTLTWRGCLEVARLQLGEAKEPPFTLAGGLDRAGNAYVIKARRYENGLVVVRNRGARLQGIDPGTAVPVSLPRLLAPVDPEGRIGPAVGKILLRNGEGAILLGNATAP